ncbi:MAG: Flp pilus assembly complex ATPase component TadA [Armatimonadetes bacterium]|nr:Flp pilus assembly complex ATPase component TadA [Armatimonadota bacterium]
MATTKKSLGDVLVERGVISAEQLRQAREVQKSAPGDLGLIIQDLGFASERDVTAARAQELGIQFVGLAPNYPLDPAAVKSVPEHVVKRYNILPIKRDGNRLMVAIGDPKSSIQGLDDVRLVSRCQITPVLAAKTDLEAAIVRAYSGAPTSPNGAGPAAGPRTANGPSALPAIIKGESLTPALISESGGVPAPVGADGGAMTPGSAPSSLGNLIATDLADIQGGGADEDEDQMTEMSEEAPIIRIAHAIVQQAIREKASDIHIEPGQRGVRIRYRIDGVLNETMTVPKHIMNPLISRFKIMAEMNIAERRVPQDGRIPIRHEGKDFDLRVSALPTMFGEKIVMRILDKSSVLLGLNKLGFSPEVQNKLEELASQPNGMLLTTGPTGSGKTTTLYSVLNKINSVEKNIVTAEDPVEYQLPGVAQVQINKKAGLTFAAALRSFLRQDPDVIMVGEMRDLETAQIAVESSLTGHLVLSTLHTNDSPSAVMRLADMGIESYLIAATVIGIIAQRLCRKICTNCKEPYQVNAAELARFGFEAENPDQMVTLYRGTGCEECRFKGYKGRVGLYEMLTMNEEIADLVVRRAPVADIRDAAKANGMKELKEDGLAKVLEGMTTPDEVMRVVFTAGF